MNAVSYWPIGPVADFADAACVGRWEWFDPPNDHESAASVQSRHEAGGGQRECRGRPIIIGPVAAPINYRPVAAPINYRHDPPFTEEDHS